MADDAFGGAWLVRETVFSPAGVRLGEVAQRRTVEDASDGRLRVVQHCTPDVALVAAGHPMAAFAGDHVFTLKRDGAKRRYLGPAVLGGALVIGEGAMIGRGVWPHFGFSFTSWSVLLAPDRQITGGVFHRGGSPTAVIVGVAAPAQRVDENADAHLRAARGVDETARPSLGAVQHAADVAKAWKGVRREVDGAGHVLGEEAATRRYTGPLAWHEQSDTSSSRGAPRARDTSSERDASESHIALTPRDDAFFVEGTTKGVKACGFARRFGWMSESEVVLGDDAILQSTEILDVERRHLVVIERVFVDQSLQRAAVLRLRPEADV